MIKQRRIAAVSLALAALVNGRTTTASTTTAVTPSDAAEIGALTAETRRDIRLGHDVTIRRLEDTTPGASELIKKAVGALVFPRFIGGSLAVGGELGNGVLRIDSKFAGAYRMGDQLARPADRRAVARAGVPVHDTGVAEELSRIPGPVGRRRCVGGSHEGRRQRRDRHQRGAGATIAFVMTNAGLMANLTFKGTKITPIE